VTSVAVGDHVIPLYTPECGSANSACRARPTCARRFAPPRAKA
jgi:Zn-dependent alcohol dehydrogenase